MTRPIKQRHAAILLWLAFLLSACSPIAPVAAPDESAVAEPGGTVPEAAEAQTTAAGIYKAFAPAASSPGLEMTLYLNVDGSVRRVNDYQEEEPPFVEVGEWSEVGSSVTITITGPADPAYPTPPEPDVHTFTLADSLLTSAERALPWYEFSALATGEVTPAYEASALEDAAAEGNFAGYYKAFLPSASCCGLDRTLLLAFDNSARLTSDYLNGEAPVVEVGTWEVDAEGRVTVTLTGMADGAAHDTPVVLVLAVEDGMLVSVEGEGVEQAFYYYPGLALPSMR